MIRPIVNKSVAAPPLKPSVSRTDIVGVSEALSRLSEASRAIGVSLGGPHKQTTADWLKTEQAKHWDTF